MISLLTVSVAHGLPAEPYHKIQHPHLSAVDVLDGQRPVEEARRHVFLGLEWKLEV